MFHIYRGHRRHRGLGLDGSEFTKNSSRFYFCPLLYIASVNHVVVTVLYLLRALHQRIAVYRKLSKIQNLDVA